MTWHEYKHILLPQLPYGVVPPPRLKAGLKFKTLQFFVFTFLIVRPSAMHANRRVHISRFAFLILLRRIARRIFPNWVNILNSRFTAEWFLLNIPWTAATSWLTTRTKFCTHSSIKAFALQHYDYDFTWHPTVNAHHRFTHVKPLLRRSLFLQ